MFKLSSSFIAKKSVVVVMIFVIPLNKQKEIIRRFQKFSKKLHIRIHSFSKNDLFFETNLKGYYTNFNTYKDNIKKFSETLKEVKDDFNLTDEDVEKIIEELKKIHEELISTLIAKKI